MKQTLADRLLAKLKKLGVPDRRAKLLAKGLAPSATRQPVRGTVTAKLIAKLLKLGLTERKATELAKGLAPLVRAAIKAKAKAKAISLDDFDDAMVNNEIMDTIDGADDPELDKVAPRVNGHRVRLDLPVAPMPGLKGIELLRVMDGLSSHATYLVAAVKSDEGIVAVRKLGGEYYNIKFYPTMGYWGITAEELTDMGAVDYLRREWYQRMHGDQRVLGKLLQRLEAEAKPKSRMKALLDRFLTVSAESLVKAFTHLHKKMGVAA